MGIFYNYEGWKKRVTDAQLPIQLKTDLLRASTAEIIPRSDPRLFRYGYCLLGIDVGRHIDDYIDADAHRELWSVCHGAPKTARWLNEHFDEFYPLVPKMRRARFVDGFMRGLAETRRRARFNIRRRNGTS